MRACSIRNLNRHTVRFSLYITSTAFSTIFSAGKKDTTADARAFKEKFDVCVGADEMKSKYFLEWREKLNKEMAVFNGKIAVDKNDGETASTVSGATANTKVTST